MDTNGDIHTSGDSTTKNDLPYWQVNVEEHERTAECPEALLYVNDKDRSIISTPNSEYTPQTWSQVVGFVESNHLELFKRWPSDLRRYRVFIHKLHKQYGSVTRFLLAKRLEWEAPVTPAGAPFENPEDIKILCNDWPYGLDSRIVHLVVWTKFRIENDPDTDDMTDQARKQVDAFVTRTFRSQVPSENVRSRSSATRYACKLTSLR